jgi:hypothetical protein
VKPPDQAGCGAAAQSGCSADFEHHAEKQVHVRVLDEAQQKLCERSHTAAGIHEYSADHVQLDGRFAEDRQAEARPYERRDDRLSEPELERKICDMENSS